ncbi:MAG: DUF1697 domain-containing protein [Flavobacteriaceae bacterium]|nr:MAG: DUF1697 domain-containing protein [Flavobacteriaceae bacterium]
MTTYISLLRGINVSGHKLIKMEALAKSFEMLGFKNIKTYLQSGNVVFSWIKVDPKEIEQKISRQIENDFGFDVSVVVLTIENLLHIVENNPFINSPERNPTYFQITFLSSKPQTDNFSVIEQKKQVGEEISFSNHAVYLHCPNGYGKTKLTNNLLESKLQVIATTRNWKTTNELLKLAKELEKKQFSK